MNFIKSTFGMKNIQGWICFSFALKKMCWFMSLSQKNLCWPYVSFVRGELVDVQVVIDELVGGLARLNHVRLHRALQGQQGHNQETSECVFCENVNCLFLLKPSQILLSFTFKHQHNFIFNTLPLERGWRVQIQISTFREWHWFLFWWSQESEQSPK